MPALPRTLPSRPLRACHPAWRRRSLSRGSARPARTSFSSPRMSDAAGVEPRDEAVPRPLATGAGMVTSRVVRALHPPLRVWRLLDRTPPRSMTRSAAAPLDCCQHAQAERSAHHAGCCSSREAAVVESGGGSVTLRRKTTSACSPSWVSSSNCMAVCSHSGASSWRGEGAPDFRGAGLAAEIETGRVRSATRHGGHFQFAPGGFMHDSRGKGVGDAKMLSSAQREWIRRQGRVARAIEASQRRASGRFSRSAASRADEPRSAWDGIRKALNRGRLCASGARERAAAHADR